MRKLPYTTIAGFCLIALLCSPTTEVNAETDAATTGVPTWKVGTTWTYQTEKKLNRTINQGSGLLQISMTLDNVSNTTDYTVTAIRELAGTECYALKMTGNQVITGTYTTFSVDGENATGALAQTSAIEGIEYRRVSDLAFVRAEMRSTGEIQLSGGLGQQATPFQNYSIIEANPPVQVIQFPLTKGKKWRVSSTLSTVTSGTSSDSIITTFNYECTVLGTRSISAEDGRTYECIAISQEGTRTEQSQNSGIHIDKVKGAFFYSPTIGNRVRDEAEGETLLEFSLGQTNTDTE